MAQYDGTVLINTKIDDTGLKEGLAAMERDLEKAYATYDQIIRAIKTNTAGVDQIKAAYDSLNATIDIYKSKLDEATKKNEIMRNIGGVVSSEDEMRVKQLSTYLVELQDLAGDLQRAMNGTAPAMEPTEQVTQQTAENTRQIAQSTKEAKVKAESAARSTKKWETATKQVHEANKKVNKSLGKSILQFAKYALGISGAFMLFRKVTAAVKEGMTNLAGESEETAAAISSIKNAFKQLKNSVGAMLQPLLMAITPALNAIIKAFTDAFTAVGHFIAALTGQEYVYEAVKINDDLAKSTDKVTKSTKAATKALGAYDKLNIIDNGANGAGTAEGTAADAAAQQMFKKVNINSKIKSFVDDIKDAFKNSGLEGIATIFDGIGRGIFGTLDKIFGTDLKGWFNSLAEGLSDYMIKIQRDFKDNGLLHSVATVFTDLGKTLTGWIDDVLGTDITGWLDDLTDTLADGIDEAMRRWGQISNIVDKTLEFYSGTKELNNMYDNIGAYSSKEIANQWKSTAAAYKRIIDMAPEYLLETSQGEVFKKASKWTNLAIGGYKQGAYNKDQLFEIMNTLTKDELQELMSELYKQGYVNDTDVVKYAEKYLKGKSKNLWPELIKNIYDRKKAGEFNDAAIQNGNENSQQTYYTNNPVYTVTLDVEKSPNFDEKVADARGVITGDIKGYQGMPSNVMTMLGIDPLSHSKLKTEVKDGRNIVTGKAGYAGMPSYVRTALEAKNLTSAGVKEAKKYLNAEVPSSKTITVKATSDKASFKSVGTTLWNTIADLWNNGAEKITYENSQANWTSVPTAALKYARIPHLAQGAVIPANRQFLAVLGDQKRGTNIEAPLDTIVAAVEKALGKGGNNQPIVLTLDGRVVAESVWSESEKRYKQVGGIYGI